MSDEAISRVGADGNSSALLEFFIPCQNLLFVFDFDVEGVGQLDGRTFAGVDGPAKDFAAMDILQVDGEPFCSGDMQFLFRMIEWQFDFV